MLFTNVELQISHLALALGFITLVPTELFKRPRVARLRLSHSPPAPMSTQAAAPAPAAGDQQPEQESTFRRIISIVQQVFIFWTISQVASKFLFNTAKTPEQPQPAVPATQPDGTPIPVIDPRLLPPVQAHLSNHWSVGQTVDMYVYFTTTPLKADEFSSRWMSAYSALPNFVWDNITFGDYSDTRVVDLNIAFPPSVRNNNGSLWADVYLAKNGANPNPSHPKFSADDVHHIRKLLTPYLPREKVRKVKSLLSSNTTEEPEEEEADVILPHWHPNVTLALISDESVIQYANLPPPLLEHIHLVPDVRDPTGRIGLYKPINSTTKSLPVQIVFQPMSFLKFQIFATMTHGFAEAAKQQGGGGER
ncbi:hypothetical protein HMN09_01162100 [Mycena chlorophos]|uniref:Cleft lip and palate associated transmembrane protein n=1 Tax=Mycena chlorophos TaxID=658473 RepID=A0A8H6S8U5_MYCCL|nr:hypothetical protein HMN09_01162100 [Mycena chlorophos]